MRIAINLLATALAGFSCLWFWGCVNDRGLAGGTETQNPEIVACAQHMAKAAFDAMQTNDEWRPTHYGSAPGQSSVPGPMLKISARAVATLAKQVTAASNSDTVRLSGAVTVIHDTSIIFKTTVRIDTVFVNKTQFSIDTIFDTITSVFENKNRASISEFIQIDSTIMKDTLFIPDTIIRQYKRIVTSVRQHSIDMQETIVQADTQMVDQGIINANQKNTISGANQYDYATMPSWSLDSVVSQSGAVPLVFQIIDTAHHDTLHVGPSHLMIKNVSNKQLFVSLKTFDNSQLVALVGFFPKDSLLSIMRFYPSLLDTIDTLDIAYSVDIGIDQFSGADDRLKAVRTSYAYRIGDKKHLALTLTPDSMETADAAGNVASGRLSIDVTFLNSKTGRFGGVVDRVNGLTGIFEFDGKKYQINCDGNLKAHVVEIR
jgi:hypothetical protein